MAAACGVRPLVALPSDERLLLLSREGSVQCATLGSPVRSIRWARSPRASLLAASALGEIVLLAEDECTPPGVRSAPLSLRESFWDDTLVCLEWLDSHTLGAGSVLPHGVDGFVTVGACAGVTVRWRQRFSLEVRERAAWSALRAQIPSVDLLHHAAVGALAPAQFMLAVTAHDFNGNILIFMCSLARPAPAAAVDNGPPSAGLDLFITPMGMLTASGAPSPVLWMGIGNDRQVLVVRRRPLNTVLQLWHAFDEALSCRESDASSTSHPKCREAPWSCVGEVTAEHDLGGVRTTSCGAFVSSGAPTCLLLLHEGGAISAFDCGDWSRPPHLLVRYSAAVVRTLSNGAACRAWQPQSEHPGRTSLWSEAPLREPCIATTSGRPRYAQKRPFGSGRFTLHAAVSPSGTFILLCRSYHKHPGASSIAVLPLRLCFDISRAPMPSRPARAASAKRKKLSPSCIIEGPGEREAMDAALALQLPQAEEAERGALWLAERVALVLDGGSPCQPWDLLGAQTMRISTLATQLAVAAVLRPLRQIERSPFPAAATIGALALAESKWRQAGPRGYALLAAIFAAHGDIRTSTGYRLLLALAVSGTWLIDQLRLITPPSEATFLNIVDEVPCSTASSMAPAPSPPRVRNRNTSGGMEAELSSATTPVSAMQSASTAKTSAERASAPAIPSIAVPAPSSRSSQPAAPDYSVLLPECEWLLNLTWLWLEEGAEARRDPQHSESDLYGAGEARHATTGVVSPSDDAKPWHILPPPVRTVLSLATAIALKASRAAEADGKPRSHAAARLPVASLVALHRAVIPHLGTEPTRASDAEDAPEVSAAASWRLDGVRRRLGLGILQPGRDVIDEAADDSSPLPRLDQSIIFGPLRAFHALANWAGLKV